MKSEINKVVLTCDNCEVTSERDVNNPTFGGSPHVGWVTLSKRMGYVLNTENIDRHFCTYRCLVQFVNKTETLD